MDPWETRRGPFPRVVSFAGDTGLRRTLGGLASALHASGAADARKWLTGVRIGPGEPIDPAVAWLLPPTLDDVSVHIETGVDGASRQLHVMGRCRPVPELMQRIVNADVIVVGPGSLYSRILPSLLVGGVAATVFGVRAVRIYVANLTTEPGDTDDFTVADCLDVIRQHSGVNLFDYVVVDRAQADPAGAMRRGWGHRPMRAGPIDTRELVVVEEDLAEPDARGRVRHAPGKLARAILGISRCASTSVRPEVAANGAKALRVRRRDARGTIGESRVVGDG